MVTTFGEGQPQAAKARCSSVPSQGVLLIAGNLPPAPPGKAYEMWIIKDGKAQAAGMFQSEPDGSAMHMQRGAAENTDAVAVTLENEGGRRPAHLHALVRSADSRVGRISQPW